MSIYSTKGRIFNIQRFSIHDGPGIRTIVFFKGCFMRCAWCCNPESQAYEIQTMVENGKTKTVGQDVTVEEILPRLTEDTAFYEASGGGVTISGGEPLLQADFVAELLRALRAKGINTAVDTCGAVPQAALEKVMPYTDTFLYDIKAIDDMVHRQWTGMSNAQILQNLLFLDAHGCRIEVRIPLIPQANDGEVARIGAFLQPLTHICKVKVLPYHPFAAGKYESLGQTYTMPPINRPTRAETNAAVEVLRRYGLPAVNGGSV
jgi:pyruvate formate lyase activating enzyme